MKARTATTAKSFYIRKRTELPQKYALTNEQLENMGQPVEKPEPTMLELNGGDDDDAVVPVFKRAKYEQIFEPAEPTEQEKEIIKEYVFEDFFSSLVSFYTPEYYTCSNVEPTKDLYWCSLDTDTELLEVPSMPPDFELLALCS